MEEGSRAWFWVADKEAGGKLGLARGRPSDCTISDRGKGMNGGGEAGV